MGIPSRRRNDALILACFALTALIGWLVYVLLGEVHHLAAQAACVLAGGVAIAGVWHVLTLVARADPASGEGSSKAQVRSFRLLLFWIAYWAWLGAESIYRVDANDIGERAWWWGVIGAFLSTAALIYALVDLVRERDARAEQRKGEWAPWG